MLLRHGLLLGLIWSLSTAGLVALEPTPIRIVPAAAFRPVLPLPRVEPRHTAEAPVPSVSGLLRASAPPPTPPPRHQPVPKPIVVDVTTPRGSHDVAGKASWYCSVEKPICHWKYPPGSMVAAACAKLRRAMGPNWRGKLVTVVGPGPTARHPDAQRKVVVALVDSCASTDKLIDLYRKPMSDLGGSGTLNVRVYWR